MAIILIFPFFFFELKEMFPFEISDYLYWVPLAGITFILFVFFNKTVNKFVLSFLEKIKIKKIETIKCILIEYVKLVFKSRLYFLLSIIVSIIVLLFFSYFCILVTESLTVFVSYSNMMMLVLVMYVASILPISFNGLGVKESVMVYGLHNTMGIGSSEAVAISLLVTLLQYPASISGGILFLMYKNEKKESRV